MIFHNKNNEPCVSFVVVARNDDHGGNFLHRVQIFVSALLEQIVKNHLKSELIIVEWNPPTDRPRLSDALTWSHKSNLCKIRLIEVPYEIHKKFLYNDKFPLFEYIGKNVGIRRACAKFIISTNPDLLYSDELVRFLASKSLNSNFFYRIDRTDVKADVPYPSSVAEQLEYCRHNVTKVHKKQTIFEFDSKERKGLLRNFSFENQRYKEIQVPYPQLHTNASGDFTMMAKKKWHELRGYSELEMVQTHIDSIICHMAYQYRLKEKVLNNPMRLYHMEHAGSWNAEKANEKYQHYKDIGVPFFDFEKFQSIVSQMHKERSPKISNNENWGLGNKNLPEMYIN